MEVRKENMIFEAHPEIKGTHAEVQMYSELRPLKGIARKVDAWRRTCGAPAYVAAHVRRTDHWTAGITEERQTSDSAFESFFAAHPHDALFLATDNVETQRLIASRLKPRQLHAQAMERRPTELRQTDVGDAVVDLFVCASARAFAGSFGSSFSDTVAHLRSVRGTACAADAHVLMGREALSGVGTRPTHDAAASETAAMLAR